MTYQIDQSGKIEQLSKHTILCLSNGSRDTVLIKAKTKRQIQEIFRRHGQVKNFVLFTFSAAVSLLIKKNAKLRIVVIDREYHGKEAIIKNIILKMINKSKCLPEICFEEIGRKVNTHKYAYLTFINKRKPDFVLNIKELLREIKKTEVGSRLKDA